MTIVWKWGVLVLAKSFSSALELVNKVKLACHYVIHILDDHPFADCVKRACDLALSC